MRELEEGKEVDPGMKPKMYGVMVQGPGPGVARSLGPVQASNAQSLTSADRNMTMFNSLYQ